MKYEVGQFFKTKYSLVIIDNVCTFTKKYFVTILSGQHSYSRGVYRKIYTEEQLELTIKFWFESGKLPYEETEKYIDIGDIWINDEWRILIHNITHERVFYVKFQLPSSLEISTPPCSTSQKIDEFYERLKEGNFFKFKKE